ncbi:hypothetical protein [Cognatilysobacter terrigena]|uniref:hypothetical protein n=1 Tax=Cognatilysobacter terrigena TaxID=2488749 RepID=UPI00105B97E3|nr:hypothetical protein [Lysobacter terrigena]
MTNALRTTFISLALLAASNIAQAADWSPYFVPAREEIGPSGVYLITPLSGLSLPGCNPATTYNYVQFPSTNEKLADRALASVYFAQSNGKRVRAYLESCSGGYAVASAIWIE